MKIPGTQKINVASIKPILSTNELFCFHVEPYTSKKYLVDFFDQLNKHLPWQYTNVAAARPITPLRFYPACLLLRSKAPPALMIVQLFLLYTACPRFRLRAGHKQHFQLFLRCRVLNGASYIKQR